MDELGGKNETQAIRLRMKLVSDQVLEQYTWRGTGEKKAFVKLNFLNDLTKVCDRSSKNIHLRLYFWGIHWVYENFCYNSL